MIWKTLGITTPATSNCRERWKLRDLPSMGAKSETAILDGLVVILAHGTNRIGARFHQE
ncbi:MAG: hypothetical protein U0X92_12540 [Anaerolineales bacterium]